MSSTSTSPAHAGGRRRARVVSAALAAAAAAALVTGTPAMATATATASPDQGRHDGGHGPHRGDLGRQVIRPGADGWASVTAMTYPEGVARLAAPVTGGATAARDQVYVVDTWDELRDALAGKRDADHDDGRGNEVPRIVYVRGHIDAFEGRDCQDFADQVTVEGTGDAFTMADYVAHYDPAGAWGWAEPSGPLEDARVAAAAVQARQTQVHVGSNVTLVGVGDDAQVSGANLRIRDSHNVILRNLRISDGRDCFPQWDPGDGDAGNWNSAYDNVSVWTSTSVWVDHNTFDDGEHPAEELPVVFGRPFEIHDGLLDITHGSDLVTVSYNRFEEHDKTMLVGSSDSRRQDAGQHRVTLHHNLFRDVGQRAPRVRFGDVHLYDNLYEQTETGLFQYYWGVGIDSSIVAENNALELARGSDAADAIARFNGTRIREDGTLVNGRRTDVLAAFNASAPAPLLDEARWTPSDHYSYRLLPTRAVAAVVHAKAGAGVLH